MFKERRVAVFDIDGTVFRSSLFIELVEELINKKIFPKKARQIYSKEHKKWLDRYGSYDEYLSKVIEAFDNNLKGVKEKDFVRISKKIANSHGNRVYRYTRKLIQELKAKNYFLLAISHSPKYVVEEFAKKLGFDKVYGAFLEVDERGVLTGRVLYWDIMKDKAKILKRAVEKEGLTLTGSVGVGDSESDIPFLKIVSKPICFNPSSRLYRTAKRKGWQIVVERKDVIYKL